CDLSANSLPPSLTLLTLIPTILSQWLPRGSHFGIISEIRLWIGPEKAETLITTKHDRPGPLFCRRVDPASIKDCGAPTILWLTPQLHPPRNEQSAPALSRRGPRGGPPDIQLRRQLPCALQRRRCPRSLQELLRAHPPQALWRPPRRPCPTRARRASASPRAPRNAGLARPVILGDPRGRTKLL
ncbi:hypothetical protein B0H11DRAFT_2269468, partial [Mycena galericulata]